MNFITLHELISELTQIEKDAYKYVETAAQYFYPPGYIRPLTNDDIRITIVDNTLVILQDFANKRFGFKMEHDGFGGIQYVSHKDINTLLNADYVREENKKRNPTGFYTYLIHDKNSNLFKIGRSKDPQKRMKTLANAQSATQPSLELVVVIYADVESFLHHHFVTKRHHGEWYMLDDKDVKYIKRGHFIDNNIRISYD